MKDLKKNTPITITPADKCGNTAIITSGAYIIEGLRVKQHQALWKDSRNIILKTI